MMTFYAEKDLALCGLACVLCSNEGCPGCKARGCKAGSDCSVYQCATQKGLDGCYQCDDFPCEEKMLEGIRNRAFNRYARQYSKQSLLDHLRLNFENGIVYHKPDGLKGDYDLLTTEEDILRLIHFGTDDPYKKCPVLETEHFTIRLLQTEDAEHLLTCYADPKSQAIFNADCCTSDFCYQTLDEMKVCIDFWLKAYEQQEFVRFAIVDKSVGIAVGTIEMFGMVGQYKTPRGLLRLDLASPYEQQAYLEELLKLCTSSFYQLFDATLIVTKAIPAARGRVCALIGSGFEPFEWPDAEREHYWLHNKQ